MRKLVVPLAMFVAAIWSTTVVAGDIESGLKPGESAGAYNVKDITGPNQGKSLCYR